MNGFPDVDAIVQEMIEGSPRESRPRRSVSDFAGPNLTADVLTLQVLLEFHYAAETQILPEDFPNRVRLLQIDNQLMIHAIVTK